MSDREKIERAAEDIIREQWPNKGPCLVPHKSAATKDSCLLTCHENDFCLCDMRKSFKAGTAWRDKYPAPEVEGLVKAIEVCLKGDRLKWNRPSRSTITMLLREALSAYRTTLEGRNE